MNQQETSLLVHLFESIFRTDEFEHEIDDIKYVTDRLISAVNSRVDDSHLRAISRACSKILDEEREKSQYIKVKNSLIMMYDQLVFLECFAAKNNIDLSGSRALAEEAIYKAEEEFKLKYGALP